MKKSPRLCWLIVCIAFIAALGTIFWANNAFYRESVGAIEYTTSLPIPRFPESAVVRIELDFGNGTRRLFEGVVFTQESPYSLEAALREIARISDIRVQTKNSYIESINGIGGKNLWNVYRNGERTDMPLRRVILAGGERYLIKLEP